MQISYLHIQQLLVIIGEWIVALQNKYILMGFIQLEEHCEWFLVHTGDAELFSKIAVNASSTLLDHHWLSFIQVLGWALMTNSQSQDLITILAKVKWWVMLCFFQVEQIIHKCCLGVELLHYSTSTPLPVHQLDLESSNLEFQWIYYYVARWEKWSQGSTSPTQAGRFPPKLRPSSYISTTLFVWRILIHNWQVGVQPQEANPLHLFDAYTQVENCKLENPNVQNW